MSRSIESLRQGQVVSHAWLSEITLLNSGGTLYFSDRNITVGGRLYENYIESVGPIMSELGRRDSEGVSRDVVLVLKNLPWGGYDYLSAVDDTTPFYGASITISEVLVDAQGLASDIENVYRGVLEEPFGIDTRRMSIRAASAETIMDKTW